MTGSPLPPIDFKGLNEALLHQAETLLPQWLSGGQRVGREYTCASLSGGAGHSCSVNLSNGRWADFATDVRGGDLISLYAAIHGIADGQAALELARSYGLEDVAGVRRASGAMPAPRPAPKPAPAQPPQAAPREGWHTLMPVPSGAVPPTFAHQHRAKADITHTARYERDGALFGYVVRFRTSDGGKDVLPYTFCQSEADSSMGWRWRQFDEPRPLYLPGLLSPADGQTVVVVEGEKKADALQTLLTAARPGVYCVASWPGGCKAWNRTNWSWLAGRDVLLWPDCDAKRAPLTAAERKACAGDAAAESAAKAAKPLLPPEKQPGTQAMLDIGHELTDKHACRVQILPIPAPGEVKDGWDCGDAIETDGWDAARVLAFFAQAQPLPPAPASGRDAPPTGGGAASNPPQRPAGAGQPKASSGPAQDWLAPFWDADKCRWHVSRKLVIKALRHDPALAGVLGYNELANGIEARRAWPWANGEAGPIKGHTDLALGQYLTDAYGLPSIARTALAEGIETVAQEQRFHPIREWLAGLEWDGKNRIDKWLIHVLGHRPEELQPAMHEYLRQVGRFWVLGMVYRVMQPGCKFDYCPVLEGPGGMGKSTLVETLATTAFFSDTHFDVGKGKDGQEQVQGLWSYEIAELANFNKSDIALIKAFITAKVDRYRPAYGRVLESYPRQCVMVGTTNERTYLRDRTGNRRFWPVPVRQRVDNTWLSKYRGLLFAEAYALYQRGESYTPTPADEERLFKPMQDSRLIETAVQSDLMRLLTRQPIGAASDEQVNCYSACVTMSDLVRAMGADAAKSNAGLEAQIRAFMEHEGWDYTRRRIGGVRMMCYVRPPNWPPQDADEPPMDAPLAAHELPEDAPPPPAPVVGGSGASQPHESADVVIGDVNAPF